jgi:hypothetical protein
MRPGVIGRRFAREPPDTAAPFNVDASADRIYHSAFRAEACQVIVDHQSPPQYTDSYQARAASPAESLGAARVARNLWDLGQDALVNWIGLAHDGVVLNGSKRQPVNDHEAAISRLRAENAQLRTERDS